MDQDGSGRHKFRTRSVLNSYYAFVACNVDIEQLRKKCCKLEKNRLLLVFQVNFPSATDISHHQPPFCRLIARIWFSAKKRPTLAQTSVLVMGVLCRCDLRCRRGIKSLTAINCSHCISCRLQMFTYVPAAKINGRSELFSKCWSKYGVKSRS